MGRPAGCRLLHSVRCHRSRPLGRNRKRLACASVASTNSDLTTLCTVNSGQPTRFLGGAGIRGSGATGAKKKTSLRGKRAYVVHLTLPSFPQQVRWADLRDAVSFTPFAAIVLTAGPKSQKARLRIDRIYELRLDGTLHGEIWPAHEVFGGSRDTGDSGATGPKNKTSLRGTRRRTPDVVLRALASLIPSAGEVGRPAGCRLLHSVRCHRSDRRAEIAKGSPAHRSHLRTPI